MAGPAISEFAILEATLEVRRLQVDAALRRLHEGGQAPGVAAAMEDSLFAPAKRLRPILSLLVAEMLREEEEHVLPAACAIEMAHTASLILDDLPCMDDATSRRGRPACHKVHGEATAILAAFALLNRAFAILAQGWPEGPGPGTRVELARDLSAAVGLEGMIAGQAQDLAATDQTVDFATLEFIHSRKTGALFTAAAALGAMSARAEERAAIIGYAKNLGLAFQVVDDLIDVTGGEKEAGKDVGQDLKKTTFVSFSGVEGARDLAQELITAAQEALARFGPRAQPLRDVARYVVTRVR